MSRFAPLVCLVALALLNAQNGKKYKDDAEFQLHDQATKDFAAGNFAKTIADLDAWKEKYPESEFNDDRQLLYVQAYSKANQPAKAIDAAAPLFASGSKVLAGPPEDAIRLLYTVSASIPAIADPTGDQMEAADKAATALLTYDRSPAGVTPEAWTQLRGQLQAAANGALLYIALTPIGKAMKTNNCADAEAASLKAVEKFPESAQAAWYLGSAALCQIKTHPEKASLTLYEFARAAVLDPAKGMVDPKWQKMTVEPSLQKLYTQYHGADADGLKQLKETALKSPTPPDGFKIKSAAEIAQDKDVEFASKNPELALWNRVKTALADSSGEQYFASDLRGVELPQLYGVLVEAKPACRPRLLLVAPRAADGPKDAPAEITLKLDKPLPGKPEAGSAFHWQGQAAEFTREPFMLTMDTDTAKIPDLHTMPCATVQRPKRAR
ncbi:MAG TPA: hypothetical protein VKU01_05305 [Bryobacteraceae bacterium]|nr:hypothetical protein [Bryobacteraceae bacterium]